ncbi:PCRF domain-containing protein [Candidatus Gracilibacteria bacterium]|nr:PCRF domain-containing protein [Candidatus Gracilibacteria bacterium]NJS40891.1 PCRF domain-containing protein [Candidatus Gracilibacteria bacterium]
MSKLPLEKIINRYNELSKKMAQTSDTKELIELSKEQNKFMNQYEIALRISDLERNIEENNQLIKELSEDDIEMVELTKLDNEEKSAELEQKENKLLSYLTPEDPRDDSDILLEIRAGAGGDESSLFATEMMKMYSTMAEKIGLKVKIISASVNGIGGYKEVVAEIRGFGAYSWYKYESGVHRVQRVPSTEKQGRIHTSTTSVAIMPLIEENSDFKLDPAEVETILSTSSGKGGQSVNTTYSAVKMVHKPTGIEAQSQDERNQLQNKVKAMAVLTSRVYDHFEQIRMDKERQERQEQVGNNDRSEKIRTYNFPQDRLTDHRYSQNWNQLPTILAGGLLDVVEEIKKLEAQKNLANLSKDNFI